MRNFLLIIFIVKSVLVSSQPWMYSLSREKSTKKYDFYDIQNSFNEYWKDKPVVKGKGYKQYKRWEYFMEPRVYPTAEIKFTEINNEILNTVFNPQSAYATDWQFVGPHIVPKDINDNLTGGAGRINCITFHPADSNIIWVGAPSGGAWKTENGGQTWATTTDQLSFVSVSDIAIHPQNTDIMYLATGDGDFGSIFIYGIGIIKSTNGGETWEPTGLSTGLSEYECFRKIVFQPGNPSVMLATSNKGIYKSTDKWVSFNKVASFHAKDIEFNPSNSSVIYATSFDNAGSAMIYRSTNAGDSFTPAMSGLNISGYVNRIELAVTPANSSLVYALCSSASTDGFYKLFKSLNSGTSWIEVVLNPSVNLLGWSVTGDDTGGQGTYDLTIAVSPENENEIYVGGVNLWRSSNGGISWQIIGLWYLSAGNEYVHADHHALLFNSHNGALYSGNDGGIYRSDDKGENWQNLSDGLAILQIYRMNNFDSDTNFILAGNQDNGTVMRNSKTWNEIIGGDGMECYFDYDNENIIYGTLYYGDLRKSTNGGISFTGIRPDDDLEGAWITPVTMHPKYPNIIYAGYQSVYKTVNGGDSWTEMSPFQTGNSNLKVLKVSSQKDDQIYIATNTDLYKSVDGGESWINIGNGLPDNSITSLSISETDPNKIWVTFSGYSAGQKVYYSENGGSAWTNYSDGIPNFPVNCIVYQKNANHLNYIGTDIGVYYRNASMSQWIKFGNDLPNVIIYDLDVLYKSKKLRAATHGRGVWETDLYEDAALHFTDFDLFPIAPCVNGISTFTNLSSGSLDSLVWSFGSGANPVSANGIGPHNVVYSSVGKKTVRLTGYRGVTAYIEEKKEVVDVVSSIDFSVSPDTYSKCGNNPVTLYAGGGYDMAWSPSTGLDKTTGEKVVSTAFENVVYTVIASNGGCTAEKNITLNVTTNDNICDAIQIVEGLNGPYSNKCATIEENEPVPPAGSTTDGCQAQDGWCIGEDRIDNSLWFKFTGPPGGVVSVEADGFDDQIAIYSAASCEDLATQNYDLLRANDDFFEKSDYSAVISELTGLNYGETYWLQVDGSYGGITGNFTLKLNYYKYSDIHDKTEYIQGNRVKVVPNPNRGRFTAHFILQNLEPVNITIYNAGGLLIKSEELVPETLFFEKEYNLHIPPGIYFMQMNSGNSVIREKFFINK